MSCKIKSSKDLLVRTNHTANHTVMSVDCSLNVDMGMGQTVSGRAWVLQPFGLYVL